MPSCNALTINALRVSPLLAQQKVCCILVQLLAGRIRRHNVIYRLFRLSRKYGRGNKS